MKIFLASDHAGFKLKSKVISWLREWEHDPIDLGAYSYKAGDDYPDFIRLVAKEISKKPTEYRGIVFGKSGEGEAMVCNRFKKVRATVYYGGNREIIKLSRQHNDANVLSIGADFVEESEVKEMIKLWLSLAFSGEEKHIRRINKIDLKK